MQQCGQMVFDIGPTLGAVLTGFCTLLGAIIGGYVGHRVTVASINGTTGGRP